LIASHFLIRMVYVLEAIKRRMELKREKMADKRNVKWVFAKPLLRKKKEGFVIF